MAERTVNYTMSEDTFLDIVDLAGYCIGHWASSATVYNGTYTIRVVEPEEESLSFTVGPEDYAKAALAVAHGEAAAQRFRAAAQALIDDDDASEVDGELADVLTQIACFDEIVYC